MNTKGIIKAITTKATNLFPEKNAINWGNWIVWNLLYAHWTKNPTIIPPNTDVWRHVKPNDVPNNELRSEKFNPHPPNKSSLSPLALVLINTDCNAEKIKYPIIELKTATPASSVNETARAAANNNGNAPNKGSPNCLIKLPKILNPSLPPALPSMVAPTPKSSPAIARTEIGSKKAPESLDKNALAPPPVFVLTFLFRRLSLTSDTFLTFALVIYL